MEGTREDRAGDAAIDTDDKHDSWTPDDQGRTAFASLVADHDEFDRDVPWPSDADAMMRAHYPAERWPAPTARPRTCVIGSRKPNVCAIFGGTDDTRALAAEYAAAYMASFHDEPFSGIAALLHPRDRGTPVGRAFIGLAPPSCIHENDSWIEALRPPACLRRRRLILIYASPNFSPFSNRRMVDAAMNSRHFACDMVLVLKDVVPAPPLRNQFDVTLFLPPFRVPRGRFLDQDNAMLSVNDMLAHGHSVMHSHMDSTSVPFHLDREETTVANVGVRPQDRFYAYASWRMHYALTRARSQQMRNLQRSLGLYVGRSSLASSCARTCGRRLDTLHDANIPSECMERIIEAVALSVDLADDHAATYAVLAALRRCLPRYTDSRMTVDMSSWPAASIVRHFVQGTAQRMER